MTSKDTFSFTIKVPIHVETGVKKKTKHYLNLNLFRNQTGHLNNDIKKIFKAIVVPMLPDLFFETFELHYELFLPNKLKRDISNVLSIIDKNFSDAFVESGHAHDDNYDYLKTIVYTFGGYDEDKLGYALITVTGILGREFVPVEVKEVVKVRKVKMRKGFEKPSDTTTTKRKIK